MAKATRTRKTERLTEKMTEEQFQQAISKYSDLNIKMSLISTEMDQQIKEIKDEYNGEIEELNAEAELLFTKIKNYCLENREPLMGNKKTYENLYGKMGFRKDPPSVKLLTGVKNETVIARLKERKLDKYIRVVEEVNKEELLANRDTDIAAQFGAIGIKIVQDEKFFIELDTTAKI